MTVRSKKIDRLMRELKVPAFNRHPGWCDPSPTCTDPIVEDNPHHRGRTTTMWPLGETDDRRVVLRLEQNVFIGEQGEPTPGRIEIIFEITDRLMGDMEVSLHPDEARQLGKQLARYASAAEKESRPDAHWYAPDDLGLSSVEFMLKHGAITR